MCETKENLVPNKRSVRIFYAFLSLVDADFLFLWYNVLEMRLIVMQMHFHRKLPIPQEVKKEFPLTSRMEEVKAARDAEIRAVFEGTSDKFLPIFWSQSIVSLDSLI